ncbi:MAG: hypothetical protein COA78_15485 [Blastopirellula sp.]|nr:MAG: hypothetical protein COA78_15485 [Blastopirellula sp.]
MAARQPTFEVQKDEPPRLEGTKKEEINLTEDIKNSYHHGCHWLRQCEVRLDCFCLKISNEI